MTKKKDWLPPNHQDFENHSREMWNYLNGAGPDGKLNRDRLGLAAESRQGEWLDKELTPKYNDYTAAFVGWENPATRDPVKIRRLKSAEAAFKKVYRQLYNGFLKSNPLVTDDDDKTFQSQKCRLWNQL